MGKDIYIQTRDALAEVQKSIECRHENQYLNNEMADTVNQYKSETAAFYDNKGNPENSFLSATQTLWYQHYLNKKALRKKEGLGCIMRLMHLLQG